MVIGIFIGEKHLDWTSDTFSRTRREGKIIQTFLDFYKTYLLNKLSNKKIS
jgi:hypothetical protein